MKKVILISFVIVIGIAFNAHALPLWDDPTWEYTTYNRSNDNDDWQESRHGYTGDDYTGFYIGTIEGNTNGGKNNNLLYQAIDHYLPYTPTDNMETTKVDDIEAINALSYNKYSLTVTWNDSLSSGEWELISNDHNYVMNFYAIKGATEFALYYVNPSQAKGYWTTRHLLNNGGNIPAISHFNAAYSNPGIKPVPEPATMLLFGTGLISLAWVGRRQLQRKNDA